MRLAKYFTLRADKNTDDMTGLVAHLTQATHGIGFILEHRYYGTFFPTPDISTENLRFLTTEQALADQAFFSQHIKFPGLVSHFLFLSGGASISIDEARPQSHKSS